MGIALVIFLLCREYRSKFLNTETVMFCLRVMVGTVILYDHVSPAGAFAKTSSVDVSGVTIDTASLTDCKL